ncbi:MAG: EF-P lysine aminoacylase EpmA [Desulfopila sp.]
MLSVQELHLRAALLSAVRSFFSRRAFLEVDTPVRQPVILPESNIEPLHSGDHFLQSSPEQYMKRLLAHGCTNIFQLCPCFRREERGRRHLEEFTMLEWYRSGADYGDLMDDCHDLVCHIHRQTSALFAGAGLSGVGRYLCLNEDGGAPPWPKITVEQAFQRWSPISLIGALDEESFDEIVVEHIEPKLGGTSPAFLCDYPARMASLARKKHDDPSVAERFELYIAGIEIANGFSELTDGAEQRCRFDEELERIAFLSNRTAAMPEAFLRDLEKLDSCAGIAFGVDRLFMLMLGKDDINDAVVFSPLEL